jgi:hypothetical protein
MLRKRKKLLAAASPGRVAVAVAVEGWQDQRLGRGSDA